jgi:hypothetical protein
LTKIRELKEGNGTVETIVKKLLCLMRCPMIQEDRKQYDQIQQKLRIYFD